MRYWTGRFLLWALRWKAGPSAPPIRKFVQVLAPHTSNWDPVYMVSLSFVYGVHFSWMIKKEWFIGPLGWLIRSVGGVPIDRSSKHNMVEQMVERMNAVDDFILGIPPEGTRKRADYWRSGFYQIAVQAKVPIVLSYLNYQKREGGYGPIIEPTGDAEADMKKIADFYRGEWAKYPNEFGPMRLRPAGEIAGPKRSSAPAIDANQ